MFLTCFPQPASTASKAPASTTASKAPAKAESKAKKTASKTSAAGADGDKKKRRKARKETYSSYIYKGTLCALNIRNEWGDEHVIQC